MSESAKSHLAVELGTFQRLLPWLLDRTGDFALVVGEQPVGVFTTWEDACKAGYLRVGAHRGFLVKRIEQTPSVNYFTRSFGACPT